MSCSSLSVDARYDKVILPWTKVARRIDELIADGKYMSQRELDYIPEYEKDELAREVVGFYPYQPEDLPRPFPYGTDFMDGVKIVRPQLDEPGRVTEILTQMAAILDNTADFDRNYESMRKAFDDLTDYQNGTYSLFSPVKPAEKETAAPAPKAPEPSAVPIDEAAVYDLQLGATVYIGTDEYEIYSFDDTHAVLRDMKFPLFTRDMPREEFDRKLRENRLNDGLIKASAPQEGQEPEVDEDAELKEQIRDTLDWRGYIVSDELIEEGLSEYDNRGGTGDYKDIADFIEHAYKRLAIPGKPFVFPSRKSKKLYHRRNSLTSRHYNATVTAYSATRRNRPLTRRKSCMKAS